MNPETQQSRKAAKALLVLMPLLGITYVLILTGSKNNPIYEYIRALLISTQVKSFLPHETISLQIILNWSFYALITKMRE